MSLNQYPNDIFHQNNLPRYAQFHIARSRQDTGHGDPFNFRVMSMTWIGWYKNDRLFEVSTCPIVVVFFHGCLSEVVVPSYAVGSIHISGKRGFVSFINEQSYDMRKFSNILWPDGRIRLFAHYPTSLSSL